MKKHILFLDFLHQWMICISGGRSTYNFLEIYCTAQKIGKMELWQQLIFQIWKDPYSLPMLQNESRYEKLCIRLLRCSLLGGSIQEELSILICEYEEFAVMQTETQLQKLPIYLSMVMLLLLFPAYLCLLLGPLIQNLLFQI